MKRSRSLSLILMGSLTLGAAGCGGGDRADEGMHAFADVGECVDSGLFSQQECSELYADALARAPRFASREECERAFGDACAEASAQQASGAAVRTNGTQVMPHSGSSWMPMMAGFMLGRFMGGGGMMQNSQGLYREPGRDPRAAGDARAFRTGTGEVVRTDAGGRVTNPSARVMQSLSHDAKPVMGRSGSGARGGFSGGIGGGS